jgi:hypothetical protein
MYLAMFSAPLYAPLLRRSATIVWDRRHVGDARNLETGVVQRSDRRFAARAGSLDVNVKIHDTELLCGLASTRCGDLRRKRCALTRAAKTGATGGCLSQGITLSIGNRDDGVVEGGVDVCDPIRHLLLYFFARAQLFSHCNLSPSGKGDPCRQHDPAPVGQSP